MRGKLTAVLTGFPALADALSGTGHFVKVHSLSATSQLRDLIRSGELPQDNKDDLVFLFADNTPVDTPQTLELLIASLTNRGWKVIVLALTPRASDIVAAHPGAGLLEAPFSANLTLGAISGLGGGLLEPVPNGFDTIDPWNQPGPVAPVQSAPAPPTPPTPTTPPAPTPAPVAAPASAVDTLPVPAQPAPAQWARPEEPAAGGWARPAEPVVAPAPAAPVTPPAPVVAEEPIFPSTPVRPLAPRVQESDSGPWATAPAQPAPVYVPVTPPPGAPVPPVHPSQGSAGQALIRPAGTSVAPSAPGGLATPGGVPGRRNARVIIVTSPKGGTGKSSLSLNLAAYLGLRVKTLGKRVCLIDANFQQADAGKMLNQYTPNIIDILKDTSSLSPTMIERYLISRPNLNLSVLLGPIRPTEANPASLNARLFNQILDALRPNFDYIFIDTPVAEVYHDLFRGFALPVADYIIVPLTPAVHTMMDVDAWLHTVTLPRHTGGDDVDPRKVGIVLNQEEDGVSIGEAEVQRELAAWNYIGTIPRSTAWINALNNSELVATKNYAELNRAFSQILYYATGEEVLLSALDTGVQEKPRRGFLRLLGRK